MVSGMDGDVSLVCCSRTELGKACPDAAVRWVPARQGASQAAPTVRDWVPSPGVLADRLVVVGKLL